MCYSGTLNNRISKLYETCLHVNHNDKKSLFQKLIDKDKSLSIHNENLKVLAKEMYKVKKGLTPKNFALSCSETSLIIIYAILLVLRCL